jgi:hypothetical protein
MIDRATPPPGPLKIEKSEINTKPVALLLCLIVAVVLAGVDLFVADGSRNSSYVYFCVTQLPYILAIAIVSIVASRSSLAFFGGVAFTTGIASVFLLIPLIVLISRWTGVPQHHDLLPYAALILLVPVDIFIAFASFRLRAANTVAFITGMVLTFFYLVASGAFLTLFPGLVQGSASAARGVG